ncbi:hypothetical protein EIP75_10530 [Aquabacterium soli]|uniref:Uncharacterized protein n=1 Tax=Aquabacterium soli TaxID=2493092 RepID=A0A426VBP3_9BURK|nr:hypothetical protein [Aquabacterium soli]RRS04323.1 hypothetical protein EIP75_10530 [Aquabacterium soli]
MDNEALSRRIEVLERAVAYVAVETGIRIGLAKDLLAFAETNPERWRVPVTAFTPLLDAAPTKQAQHKDASDQ